MTILQVNKFFYLRGGSERYFFDLCRLLGDRGHDVIHFSMKHPRNEPSAQERYFVSEVDLNAPMGSLRKARAALRILYSSEAKSRIGRLMDEVRPDVIHLHNVTRQISPSIVDAARQRGIPMVQTLHDLSLVCPAHSFFTGGRTCEDCAGGKYWHAVAKRCIDASLSSSLVGTFEAYLHAWLGLYKKVGVFIAPSLFLKTKVSSVRWVSERIVHLPYFIPSGPDYTSAGQGYVLFAGRISTEKGVGTLIEAASKLEKVRFVIAGEGAELEGFKKLAQRQGLANVEFAGYVSGEGLEALLEGCGCVVVPSVSYENLPLSILEAFARGKPVVGSDRGGIPELVIDGVTGHLFDGNDADSLARALNRTLGDDRKRREMGRRARELVERAYSPGSHYERLMDLYKGLVG